MLFFDWNAAKALRNERKHGVSFEEAKSVFFDENAIQFFDDQHHLDEDRLIMLGLSSRLRLLIVVHCERNEGRTIRIISARRATRTEAGHYLKGTI